MRVLGIDCGSERTGYGVIDSDGVRHLLIAAGAIRVRTSDPLPRRLSLIAAALRKIIEDYSPECAAIEEVFHASNSQSAIKLAQVRGVALLAAAEADLAIGEYSALTVKKSVVGYGHAAKEQVQFMTRSLLGPETPTNSPDACDALAVAICHATHTATRGRISA